MLKPIDSFSPNQRPRSGLCHSLPSGDMPVQREYSGENVPKFLSLTSALTLMMFKVEDTITID